MMSKLFNWDTDLNLVENLSVNINVTGISVALITSLTMSAGYLIYRIRQSLQKVPNMDKKCVLVTRCGSQLGQSLVQLLDQHNVTVIAGCSTQTESDQLNQVTSQNVMPFVLDLKRSGDGRDLGHVVEFIHHKVPKDEVFWGIVHISDISDEVQEVSTKDDFHTVLEANFLVQVDLTKSLLDLVSRVGGRVVFILPPDIGSTSYMTSRYALLGYAHSLRHYSFVWGLTVSSVSILQSSINLAPDHSSDSSASKCNKCPDWSPVCRAIFHALFANHPKRSYNTYIDRGIIGHVLNSWI